MFKAPRHGDGRVIVVDADTCEVKVPAERFFETRRMLKHLDIQEEAMETSHRQAESYTDENGEAIITKDIEALVKGTTQRCLKYHVSPMAVFYHIFQSIDDPKNMKTVKYMNEHFDPVECRKNKMLDFELAVRYLGLPVNITTVHQFDLVSNRPEACAIPIGLVYAPLCNGGLAMEQLNYRFGVPHEGKELLRLEFIVPATKELIDYLPNMENRYYAYKDGEDSGWRL